MSFLFGITIGFLCGLFFSQGRNDPLGDACRLLSRFCHALREMAVWAFRQLRDKIKSRPEKDPKGGFPL